MSQATLRAVPAHRGGALHRPRLPLGLLGGAVLARARVALRRPAAWRHVMIGLTEDYEPCGSAATPSRASARLRALPAPLRHAVRAGAAARAWSPGRACRAVVAAGAPGAGARRSRCCAHSASAGSRRRCCWTPTRAWRRSRPRSTASTPRPSSRVLDDPAVEAAYQCDRAEARAALGPAIAPGQDGAHRRARALHRSEPRLPPRRPRARRRRLAAAGGVRRVRREPAPGLERRATPTPEELLRRLPARADDAGGRAHVHRPQRRRRPRGDRERLLELAARGVATRTPLADDALWRPAAA